MGKKNSNMDARFASSTMTKDKCVKMQKSKIRRRYSTSNLICTQKQRNSKITHNVKKQIKKLLGKRSRDENLRRLQSALDIQSQHQIAGSALHIPSIENMVSFNDLKSMQDARPEESTSALTFNDCFSYRNFESQPELMLSYIVLLQRALNNLGLNLSSKQNEKVVKGVWNLVVRYWKDINEQNIYHNLNEKIQWGLYELLNCDLKVTPGELVLVQVKIKSLAHLE